MNNLPPLGPAQPPGEGEPRFPRGFPQGPPDPARPIDQERAARAREAQLDRTRNYKGQYEHRATQAAREALTQAAQEHNRRVEQERANRLINRIRSNMGPAVQDPRGTFIPSPASVSEKEGIRRILQIIIELKKLGAIKDVALAGVGLSIVLGEDPPAQQSVLGLTPPSDVPLAGGTVAGSFLVFGTATPASLIIPLGIVGRAIYLDLNRHDVDPLPQDIKDYVARVTERGALISALQDELAGLMHLEEAQGRMIGVQDWTDP